MLRVLSNKQRATVAEESAPNRFGCRTIAEAPIQVNPKRLQTSLFATFAGAAFPYNDFAGCALSLTLANALANVAAV